MTAAVLGAPAWTVFVAYGVSLVVIGILVKVTGLSRQPGSTWVRLLAWVAATLLIVFALIGTDPLESLARTLFEPWTESTARPAESQAAVEHAATLARVALATLAVVFLLVPGTWMDVAVTTFVALVIAAAVGDYKDTSALLACATPTAPSASGATAEATARSCPTAAPTPLAPLQGMAVRLGKATVVAPVTAVKAGTVMVRVVVDERDEQNRVTRYVTRTYRAALGSALPADKVAEDVEVYVPASQGPFVADITAAKAIYVTND